MLVQGWGGGKAKAYLLVQGWVGVQKWLFWSLRTLWMAPGFLQNDEAIHK